MVAAAEKVFGRSDPAPSSARTGARAWIIRQSNGTRERLPVPADFKLEPAAATVASLHTGDFLVYIQISYNAGLHDVASLVSVRRAP